MGAPKIFETLTSSRNPMNGIGKLVFSGCQNVKSTLKRLPYSIR